MSQRKGILERLAEGVVIGDGGYAWQLERRGYLKIGPWTPEASVEHPEAVRQLHREFLRAGSDVLQAFTFYASEDKLENVEGAKYTVEEINTASCKIAREVASEGNALVPGGLSQIPSYASGEPKAEVQRKFQKQVDVYVANNVDFLICEYFEHVEEIEWAIEVCKKTGKPVAATMCIGTEGDQRGVPAGQCAVRMARAGANIVGVNCHFDPSRTLATIGVMKKSLDEAGLKAYLMTQPLCFQDPDAGSEGFFDLPEYPFAMEPRTCTRWDVHKYARQAYELGVRYIGGCCGFEPYHIRAIAEELAPERGFLPAGSEKHDGWGACLKMHTKPWVRQRANREYWENLKPASGRPYSPSMSLPGSLVYCSRQCSA